MTQQVVVFIDYMNTYEGARRAFHRGATSSRLGQIAPTKLGRYLVNQRADSVLKEVRIYRGIPDSGRQPVAYGAASRQMAYWKSLPRVTVFARPLRYPKSWPNQPAQEKGVDVALAVDFVSMASQGQFDVGILMSADTDLRPALEAVLSLQQKDRLPVLAEVATWKAPGYRQRLSIAGYMWPHCHFLERGAYEAVQDKQKYVRPED